LASFFKKIHCRTRADASDTDDVVDGRATTKSSFTLARFFFGILLCWGRVRPTRCGKNFVSRSASTEAARPSQGKQANKQASDDGDDDDTSAGRFFKCIPLLIATVVVHQNRRNRAAILLHL